MTWTLLCEASRLSGCRSDGSALRSHLRRCLAEGRRRRPFARSVPRETRHCMDCRLAFAAATVAAAAAVDDAIAADEPNSSKSSVVA